MVVLPPLSAWRDLVDRALREDLGPGDATSPQVFPPDHPGEAAIESRQPLVVCGLPVAARVFDTLDPRLSFTPLRAEGELLPAGCVLAEVSGPLLGILAAERTALNFLSRLCGIATLTRRYVEAVAGTGARILDTRKTVPGWRVLDKYAVAVGGGHNHRMGLHDGVLVKDNHVVGAGGVAAAVKSVRAHAPAHLRVQVEVESEAQAEEALAAGADLLLFDNRSVDELRGLVARFRDRAVLEASGGIDLESVRAVAETGVHRISVGALTHSAPGADLALEVREGGARP
ncbi:MAG: carboxylating nicotinate-nucleotide diphosphorylase [Myxococcota bacterium]